MGLLGSMHCVGMCGPLALSLSAPSRGVARGWLKPIWYNAGRIATYTFLGLIVALLGEPLRMAGWQRALSIVGGLVMLMMALGYFLPRYLSASTNPFSDSLIRFRGKLFHQLQRIGRVNRFALGMLNGLLPCGMVYMALGGAAMQTTFADSVFFMTFFGLGTAPALLIVASSPSWLKIDNGLVKRLYPYAVLLVAVLLLVRGMNLGIPYLSPAIVNSTAGCTASCCH